MRLSLLFNDENPAKFKERVDLSKSRQVNAEDTLRFDKYVHSLPEDLVAPLEILRRRHILNFTLKKPKNSLEDKIEDLLKNKLLQELFEVKSQELGSLQLIIFIFKHEKCLQIMIFLLLF